MAKAPAFQFYASDFTSLTSSWTPEEVCIYMRLRASQWVNGFLVDDHDRLARIAGVSLDVFEKAWVIVGLEFALCEDNRLRDLGLEVLRRQKEDFSRRQSENGKKGGRPRKNDENKPGRNPTLNPEETQSVSQKKPLEDEDEIIEVKEEINNSDEFIKEKNNNGQGGKFLIPAMHEAYLAQVAEYAADEDFDYGPLGAISEFICRQEQIREDPVFDRSAREMVLAIWGQLCLTIAGDKFYRCQSLKTIANHIQTIIQKCKNGKGFDFSRQSANSKLDQLYS